MDDPPSDRLLVYKTVDGMTLTLALDLPEGRGPHPVCIWVHGGGWRHGDHMLFAPQSAHLATRGIAGVRINYRKSVDGVRCEETVADILDAAGWVVAHATDYGFDPARLALAGGSAGGHLSAVSAHRLPHCVAHIGYNGVYDLAARTLRKVFTIPGVKEYFMPLTVDHLKSVSPQWIIREPPPETLLFHGTADTTVPYEQSVEYAESLRAAGGNAELILFEGEGHGMHNPDRGKYQESLDATEAFLLRVFGMTAPTE